jgi:methylenetetrahydrofolate reductase (NADPH)
MSPAPIDREGLKMRIVEFLRDASIEITTHDQKYFPELRQHVNPGAVVYVAHTPKASLQEVVDTACELQRMGFRACPHIAARRMASEGTLRAALDQVREAGCDRVLLIAGDAPQPGPFPSTLEILASGILAECGIRVAGVAGHPEGNPNIAEEQLWQALAVKQEHEDRGPVRLQIVTQFNFEADRLIEWGRELRRRGITMPVHAGFAGPTPLDKLVRYAMFCGISATFRKLKADKSMVGNLAKAARAVDSILTAFLSQSTDADRGIFVQPHFFPFGGVAATAAWMRALQDGNFELKADGSGFTL